MIDKRKRDGWLGEVLAARYYRDLGYEIAEANFRVSVGEIDVIAKKDNLLVFCEVKTHRVGQERFAKDAVDEYKQRRMIAAAMVYRKRIGHDGQVRFDVAEVDLKAPPSQQVRLICQALDIN
jgi:putative endonuclease